MDPLSMSLTVVTFATAVKDVVGLGQKIHESFVKVSRNYQKAQSVAEDIKEMVDEIETFCKDHEELDKMKDFHLALLGLLAKFRNFDASVLPLLPQAGGRRRDRFTRAWDAWRNNDKIEQGILDLQSDIMKVMRRYMVKSAMRAEVKLEKIHQATSRGLTGISQGLEALEAVRRDVSVIRVTTAANSAVHSLYEASASPSNEFDPQIIMFAQSTSSASAPMLRTPDVITEELMTAAYIKLQINHIVVALDKVSKLPVPIPNDVDNFDMYPSMEISMKITDLRHFVVRQVLDIRDLLDAGTIQIISIQEGASKLNDLSIGLRALHMDAESIQLGAWAIKLARTLVCSSAGHPELRAALGLHLINQSVKYYNDGDETRSLQAIQEAYTITLNLRNQQFDRQPRFQILYSNVLLQYALLVDTQQSIEMLAEAVQGLESVLNVERYAHSQRSGKPRGVLQSSSSFLDRIISSEPPVIAISNYALALQRLGTRLFKTGHSEKAVDLHLLAIAVRRKILSIHGHEYKLDLADALSVLVQDENAKGHIPEEILISMADECIQLLWELAKYNPLSFTQRLINVLWEKAEILETMERDTEALAIWETIVSLAGQLHDDSSLYASALLNLGFNFQRLKRHDDAVRTMTRAINSYEHGPEVQALRYIYLSWDLMCLWRYKESVEAARKAVALHRRVAMRSPGTQMGALMESLSTLAHCLAVSGNCSESLIAWKESVNILDDCLNVNPDLSSSANNDCLAALQKHTLISYVLEDEAGSLKVSWTAAQYSRRRSEMCNSEILLWAEFSYAYHLLRVGRLHELQQYIEDWVDIWRGKLETTSNSTIMKQHAAMFALKSRMFDAQGCTEEALLANQRAHDIVRPSFKSYQPLFAEMIEARLRRAPLQLDLGNSEEALTVAEEALQAVRDSQLEPATTTPVRVVHGVASTALFCRSYRRAAELAREGCNICASSSWQDRERESSALLRPSLLAILASAEANLSRYSTSVGYAHQAVNASLGIRDKKLFVSPTTAEQSYIETRGNLADILLATGDSVQARHICEERRAYFSKRVELRIGEYRDLAPILRMLGILCCSEGRHEEGNTAAQELLQIMKRLRSAFPSLQEQVKIRLRHQVEVPILKILNDMTQKLDCEHQREVTSLFAA